MTCHDVVDLIQRGGLELTVPTSSQVIPCHSQLCLFRGRRMQPVKNHPDLVTHRGM